MSFQRWMLNGRPSNIEPQVESVIAVAVLDFHLSVTSTSTGPHTWTSFHFARNNPRHNGRGRAVDLASYVDRMRRFFYYTALKLAKFDESFGPPNNRFIKYGRIYPGSIPNHWNHNHVAPKFGARFGPQTRPTRPVLRQGDTGKRVRKLQRILRRRGMKSVRVTGYFGVATKSAIKRIQKKHHLKADGVVGSQTWKVIV